MRTEFATVEDALEFLIIKHQEDLESVLAIQKLLEFVEVTAFGKVNPGGIV